MTDFYLITGFLGAGKTTFLKQFLPLFRGKRIHLIINEFGAEGVDGRLLGEVGAALDEISGGSIFCTCRLDRFEQVLEDVLKTPPDVLIVEASGLADPTRIRSILSGKAYFAIQYRGTVCLIDAKGFPKIIQTARVSSRQLAAADLGIVNKCDLVSNHELQELTELIQSRRPGLALYHTSYGKMKPDFLGRLIPQPPAAEDETLQRDITLQKMAVAIREDMPLEQFTHFVTMFTEDANRVKGIIRLKEGVFLCDCVGAMVRVEPWAGKAGRTNVLNALATAGMPLRKGLQSAVRWYPEFVQIVHENKGE